MSKFEPDQFFTAAQQQRLAELVGKRRNQLDAGREMQSGEAAELECLINEELEGAAQRAAAIIIRGEIASSPARNQSADL